MTTITEHVFDPRPNAQDKCRYCQKETMRYCVTCREYICESCQLALHDPQVNRLR